MQFFWTSNFKGSPFLCQLRQEKVVYLKRKPYYPLLERSFETGQIFVMKGSRRVLVKGVLFHLRGVAILRVMPRLISYSILKALFQGFQMRYHLFPNLFEKSIKIKRRKSPSYDRTLAIVVHCTYDSVDYILHRPS